MCEWYLPYLTASTNYSLKENTSPEDFKHSEVIVLYKKLGRLKEENYRPVSLLPHASKVFEKIIYKQKNCYMEDKLSKGLTSFRKSCNHNHVWKIEKIEAATQRCSYEKKFWKYAENLNENTHAEVQFQ